MAQFGRADEVKVGSPLLHNIVLQSTTSDASRAISVDAVAKVAEHHGEGVVSPSLGIGVGEVAIEKPRGGAFESGIAAGLLYIL